MVKRYLAFWIILALMLAAIDWHEHVSRAGQSFEKYPFKWGVYTLTKCLTVVFSTIFFNVLFKSIIKQRYIREIVSFLLGMFTMQQLGPLMNKSIIPELTLIFDAKYYHYLLSAFVYSSIYWILYYFRNKRKRVL
jgi:hypothetical protein